MKLVGFLILLAMIFIAAHAAGARLGPVTTGHSQVQYVGGGTGGPSTGGMNMSGTSGMRTDGGP
jgi:hypothetical protein